MKVQNVIEETLSRIENVSYLIHKVYDLLNRIAEELRCDDVIGTKKKAADFIDYDVQTIDTLLKEGRIINYGRDRIFIFHKSELRDVREVRNKPDK